MHACPLLQNLINESRDDKLARHRLQLAALPQHIAESLRLSVEPWQVFSEAAPRSQTSEA